jgi:serine/threonine-protein kinase
MPPTVGQVINNKYRLLRHIGDGGMGSVYEARHETLGTTVALKFLHLEFSRREGLVQRFLQEARASARIQSPHVIRVADVDETADGDVFIVLEYLEGKTLQTLYEELYRAGRRLSYQEALDYAAQMLDGLEAAHQAGIVHRDLKPDNVMITLDPKGAPLLKLLDFGIAKLKVIGGSHDGGRPPIPPGPAGLTRPGVMMGTPEYMAPEQASSADAVDVRADIFSLGVIIFEMLGGQRPVGGDDPHELAAAYRTGQISQLTHLVLGIPPELAAAVHRALAADPKDRFATVAEMREAIEPFVAAARPPSPSRLRAGGTIGVSEVATPSVAACAAPPPSPPAPDQAVIVAALAPDRASSVAKTWPPDEGPPPAGPRVGGTVVDEVGPMGGGPPYPPPQPATVSRSGAPRRDLTHRMDHPFHRPLAPPAASAAVLGAPPPARRRRRSGFPVLRVVALAAGVAGLVTGSVYLTSRSSPSSKEDDPPQATAAPAPVTTVAPRPSAQPAEPLPPVPAPATPTPALTPRPGPVGPRPKPAPSGSSSVDPNPPPPPALILPTAFPFPNPFQQAPAPAPPGSGSPKQQQEPPLFPLP